MNCSFIVLGSSSGLPQAERATSGYLLKTADSLSMIDCGGGVTSSFLRRGFNPENLDRIFISHTHSDHVCELSLFIQLLQVKRSEKSLELYLPEEFIQPFKSWLNTVYLSPEKLSFEISFNSITDGFRYESDSFSLQAVQNCHLEKYRPIAEELNLPNKMQCFSFIVQVGEKKLFHSADIGSVEDVKPYLDGCDVAVVESSHIDFEQLFEFVPTVKVGKLIVTHLNGKEEIEAIGRLAEKYGINNLMFAMDGMEIGL